MSGQKIKEFFLRIYHIPYVKSPVIAFTIVAGAILIFFTFLFFFTRHGQGIEVPDFTGLSKEQSYRMAKKKRLRLEIVDSVYIASRKPGSIVDQNPDAGTLVKANRRVFLTINATTPKLIEMPDVVGVTLRQAKAQLELLGFTIETLYFTPDIAINNVLEQRYKGKKIDPKTLIPKGSAIDLLLGRGFGNEKTMLPRVIGLTLAEAKSTLIEASLNLGNLRFDNTVKDLRDSLQARVYSQYPAFTDDTPIAFGARVDIWLTLNEERIPRLIEVVDSTKKAKYEEPEEEIFE